MNNATIKKGRTAFLNTLAAQLADKGQVWTGRAASGLGAPKSRLIFLDGNGLLFDITTEDYQRHTESLVRVRINEGWGLPARFARERYIRGKNVPGGPYVPGVMVPEIVWKRGCHRLELTLCDQDLDDLVPYALGMFLGKITEKRDYVWDQRAINTLPQNRQDHFDRFAVDLDTTPWEKWAVAGDNLKGDPK